MFILIFFSIIIIYLIYVMNLYNKNNIEKSLSFKLLNDILSKKVSNNIIENKVNYKRKVQFSKIKDKKIGLLVNMSGESDSNYKFLDLFYDNYIKKHYAYYRKGKIKIYLDNLLKKNIINKIDIRIPEFDNNIYKLYLDYNYNLLYLHYN